MDECESLKFALCIIYLLYFYILYFYIAALGARTFVQAQGNTEDDEQPQHLTNDGKWTRLQIGFHGIHNFNY